MKKTILSCVCSCFAASAVAHENQPVNTQPDSLDIKTTFTYRNNQAFPSDEVWQLPGILLGGESLPVEQGASLDDVQLLGHLNIHKRYFVSAKVGAHSHDGSTEVALENLWFGSRAAIMGQPLLFEIGKMSSDITPTANFHASGGSFSESPLLADVFFARHFVDIGARASASIQGINFGIEVWNGDNWPASSGEGTAALFVHYAIQHGELSAKVGSWLMRSEADKRSDQRYEDGHSHGDAQLSASDLTFSGETVTMGSFANLQWQVNPIILNAEFEWIRADIDAQLLDVTQSAAFLATQDGYKLQLGVSLDNHSLQVKYERLVVDNSFTQTSQTFIQSSGLYNEGIEPEKLAVAWTWDFYDSFRLRTEWYQDDTQEAGTSRWAIGLVWQHKLL
ncbi:hypothetical protein [uncultured Paraglaciecola sp.]|uniref:hypothetical protein n=1 Tax=uncultured Paraglaciecola sp. TaxID=1765024 RepID=UPI0030DD1E33|tara:strand:- start:13330 stop:14508 length:1179 start_codon:yes stop_codon:yes gene_type:complete